MLSRFEKGYVTIATLIPYIIVALLVIAGAYHQWYVLGGVAISFLLGWGFGKSID